MKLQEYACETLPQSEEFTDEAKALIERLGATGQMTYYGTQKEVCPYRKMTKQEYAVYKMLMPFRETIDKYTAGPIPLRALQIGAHASELLEGTLVVWHAGVGKDDPILTLRQGSEYSGEYYLLARWADELEEFSVLLQKAAVQMAAHVKATLLRQKVEIDSYLNELEPHIEARLRDGKTDDPHFYWS